MMSKKRNKELCKRCIQERGEGEWTCVDEIAFNFGIIRCPVGSCLYDLEHKLMEETDGGETASD